MLFRLSVSIRTTRIDYTLFEHSIRFSTALLLLRLSTCILNRQICTLDIRTYRHTAARQADRCQPPTVTLLALVGVVCEHGIQSCGALAGERRL